MSTTQTANSASATTTTASSSSTQPTGIEAVFQSQWWICQLMGESAEYSAYQAEQQATIGDAITEDLQNTYDEIEEQIKKKKEYEKKNHSIGGFFSNLGKMICDISTTIEDLMVGQAEAIITGDYGSLDSKLDADIKALEQNPILEDLIKGLTYVVMAAAVVTAGMTAGPAAAIMVAGVFASTEFGLTDLIGNGLKEALGEVLPPDVAAAVADALIIAIVVTISAAIGVFTGGSSIALMAGGTVIGSMSSQVAEDLANAFGLSGDAKTYFTMAATITFVLIGIGATATGGAMAASKMRELSALSQKILMGTTKISATAQMGQGGFTALNGLRNIEVGKIMEKIMELEGDSTLLNTLFNNINSLMRFTQDAASTTMKTYNNMIAQFGAISVPGRQAAAV